MKSSLSSEREPSLKPTPLRLARSRQAFLRLLELFWTALSNANDHVFALGMGLPTPNVLSAEEQENGSSPPTRIVSKWSGKPPAC